MMSAICPVEHRGWEWGYLHRLAHGDLRTLTIGQTANHLAFSPDGRLLAVAVTGRGLVPVHEPVIRADDEALSRGRAVFETLRVYDGRRFRLDEHLDRLAQSAARIGLTSPTNVNTNATAAIRFITMHPLEDDGLMARASRDARLSCLGMSLPKDWPTTSAASRPTPDLPGRRAPACR